MRESRYAIDEMEMGILTGPFESKSDAVEWALKNLGTGWMLRELRSPA